MAKLPVTPALAGELAPPTPPATPQRLLRCVALSSLAALIAMASAASAATERISNAQAHAIRTYSCTRTAAPPVIDGDPRDACWEQADAVSGFVVRDTQQPAKLQTAARLLYDDESIYVAVSCTEPDVDRVSAGRHPRDGPVWLDDSVEVFLDCDHDHSSYFQFIVNAAGSLLDSVGQDSTWTSWGARCAAAKADGSWSVELLIPFADLGVAAPAEGEAWGLNVWRNGQTSGEGQSQWSSTAPLPDHGPLRFGDLVFGRQQYVLRQVTFGDVCQGRNILNLQVHGHEGAPADVPAELKVVGDSGAVSTTTNEARLGADATVWLSTHYEVPDKGPASLTIRLGGDNDRLLPYRATYPLLPLGWRVDGLGILSLTLDRESCAADMPVRATLERVGGPSPSASQAGFTVEMALCDDKGLEVAEPFLTAAAGGDVRGLPLTRAWDVGDLPDGRYAVSVRVWNANAEQVGVSAKPFVRRQSLYSELGFVEAEAELDLARRQAEKAPGSAFAACTTTAEFHFQRAQKRFAALPLQTAKGTYAIYGLRSDVQEVRRWTSPLVSDQVPYADATGRLLRAHRSRIDDSLQPYSVFVPPQYDPARPCPLVLILHPYDPEGGPFWEDWVGFYEYWAGRQGYLLLCPFARGNQDFRGIGEADLWQAYEETHRLYNIDPRRVYVAGISMGGTGAWHLATRYPDRFAALAAVAGRGGNVRRLVPNAANIPAYVVHGGQDDTVPAEHSRAMATAVRASGGRASLSLHPLAGHLLFPEENRNVFDWFAPSARDATPREVRYRTETLKYRRCHWVRIDALGEGRRIPEIVAAVRENNVIEVRTLNIDAYTLTLPRELLASDRDITVRTNGTVSYRGPSSGSSVSFRRAGRSRREFERVPDGAGGATGLRKRHGLQGPICEAFAAPFLYVYGTGQRDPALAAASEQAARTARDLMQQAAHGFFPIERDVDVTSDDMASHNLILYGPPAVNSIVRRLAQRLPLQIRRGRLLLRDEAIAAASVGVKMIYPNPLEESKYVVVNTGTDADALMALAQLPARFVDYAVIGRRHPQEPYQCLRDGHFDQRWKLPAPRGGVLHVTTDTSWRCHRRPPTDWSSLGFDDTDWPLAAAHSKGLWPDINFAAHLDDRAVAIWYPEPDPAHVTRYFRRSFELPRAVKWATATVLVEDTCELYVNGRRVARIGYEDGLTKVSLRRYLQPGPNVLAAKVHEVYGDQGLVLDCAIRMVEADMPTDIRDRASR